MTAPLLPTAIELESLDVVVGGRRLLHIAQLHIETGERVALIGPNGAGKSSLLRVLGGFLTPTRGRVSVLGRAWGPLGQPGISSTALRNLRTEVGQVMQGLHLVPRLTARENVILGALARPNAMPLWRSWSRLYPAHVIAEADQALAELGMSEHADIRSDRLSGGERQKVGLARLKLQRARLVLADEPTSALDPNATLDACRSLCATAQDATLLSVVHNTDLLALLADRVIGLAVGEIVFDLQLRDVTPEHLQALYAESPSPSASIAALPPSPAAASLTLTESPGRSCPLHYQYGPAVFNTPVATDMTDLDVLYVVGGLYGNVFALQEVLRMFAQETGRKRLVFNGDFHWFDVDPTAFATIQDVVIQHTALRGNVETELAQDSPDTDAGCGCGYPAWVGDEVVQRSNRILSRLRGATAPEQRRALAALPMWALASVGRQRIGIVHGDGQSLAGWGFAQEHLGDPVHMELIRNWFALAGVDVFASTHTCLPVFQQVLRGDRTQPAWVLNNGAAGMPNFQGDTAGLLTRIAVRPFAGRQRRLGVEQSGVFMDAVAIEVDGAQVQNHFLAQWLQGSDAYASYFSRISNGPDYRADQVIRMEKTPC